MFPTDKDISVPIIGINSILNALGVRLAAGGINRETQFLGEGLDSIVGTLTFSIYTALVTDS